MSGENINRRLNIYINDKQIVNSQRGIDAEMKKVRNQIRNLDRTAADYNERLAELSETYRMLRQEQIRFNQELNSTPGLLNSIKRTLGPVATGFLAAFSISSLVDKFFGSVKKAYDIVVDFNQKQADLAAIMGKSRLQIVRLTADSLKYGASTSYTSAQVSELQIELAKLGRTEKDIRAMTESILSASTALEADLGPAAEFIGGQLNSYQADASKASEFSDILANSVNVSATSFDYLSTSLPKVSKVAYLNRVEFTKLNGIMGVLADENIAAETAGTGFRNILLESAKAGKPWEKMLQDIKNSTNQSKKATELFGKENATVAVILANSTEKIKQNTEALENSAGAADKLAKEKMNSIAGSVELFSSAWEGFILNIEKGDGIIGKAIKKVIDFGTSILGLITPTRKLSDELKEEQFNLNMLVQKIQSTNTSNEERKILLRQLKEEYPAFNKFLDIENATTAQIWEALRKVNEEYVKRIALQQQVEKVEKASGKVADKIIAQQEKLFKISQELTKYNLNYKLGVKIDEGDLIGSAKKMREILLARGGVMEEGASDVIYSMIYQLGQINSEIKKQQGLLDKELEKQQFMQKSLNIETEAEREGNEALKERLRLREELIKQATKLGLQNARQNSTDELKRWIAAKEEAMLYSGEESEEEKKKRLKELEQAKKHAEELLKMEEELRKKLLETQRNAQDLELGTLREGYVKERNQLNTEYDRKIEDAKLNIEKEQKEIAKLEKAIADKNTKKVDVDSFKKQLGYRKQISEELTATLISLEKTREIKLGTLREKYLGLEIKEIEEANARELEALQTKHNFEFASIKKFSEAKALLAQFLSADELNKVKTLEDARKKLKDHYLKEEYKLQEKHLIDLIAKVQSIFAQEKELGFELISPEERKELLKFMDELAAKLSQLGVKRSEDEASRVGEGIKSLSGIDILGFTPEQWQSTFASLDTFSQKIAAVELVVGAMQNAWGKFFSFFDAGDTRSLQKFQKNTERKKRELADQLEKGYITQEIYNSRVAKLEQDLEKKQAELEYKKAKREKIAAALAIATQTAIGIMKAVAASPLTGGMPWTAIIGGLGAVELASVLAQPLPPKSGYKDGGYTGDGPIDEEAGPVHKREYVIPQKVLFGNDPVVPNIVGYLESKRKGNNPNSFDRSISDENSMGSKAPDTGLLLFVAEALNRNSEILEKIEKDGVPAFLENDIKTAKKMRDKIKELEVIENQSKR